MISRIRIDAYGATAAEVENYLTALASRINHDFQLDASFGEQVISKEMSNEEGSPYAFEGRLILHPNVAEDARQRERLLYFANYLSDNNFRWTAETGVQRV